MALEGDYRAPKKQQRPIVIEVKFTLFARFCLLGTQEGKGEVMLERAWTANIRPNTSSTVSGTERLP